MSEFFNSHALFSTVTELQKCAGAASFSDRSVHFATDGSKRRSSRPPAIHTEFLSILCASDSLVLQDPDHDAPVLGLPFGSFVVTYLPAFAHGAWRQHSGQRNVALL